MNELYDYAVTIVYEDGSSFYGIVPADNSTRAFSLALRMAKPAGSFQAPVKTWSSVLTELEMA